MQHDYTNTQLYPFGRFGVDRPMTELPGGQSQQMTRDEFVARYKSQFGSEPPQNLLATMGTNFVQGTTPPVLTADDEAKRIREAQQFVSQYQAPDFTKLGAGQTFDFGGKTYRILEPGTGTTPPKFEVISGGTQGTKQQGQQNQQGQQQGQQQGAQTTTLNGAFDSIESFLDLFSNPEVVKGFQNFGFLPSQESVAEMKATRESLSSIQAQLDAVGNEKVAAIRRVYDQAIDEMRRTNQAYLANTEQLGIRGGRQRYAPELYNSEINSEINAGIERITKLQSERDLLIAEAKEAALNKQYDRLVKSYEDSQTKAKEQSEAMRKTAEFVFKFKEDSAKKAKELLEIQKLTGDIEKNTVDSVASLADVQLKSFEESGDTEGAVNFLKEYSSQKGIDSDKLLSRIMENRAKTKAFGEPFELPGVGLVQVNAQTGEIKTLGTREREQVVIDPLTGQPRVIRLGGAGGATTATEIPIETEIPPQIRAAISTIGDIQYIDGGRLTARQIPIAQNISQEFGIPFISAKDATEVKNASKTVNSALNLLGTIQKLSSEVITAKTAGEVPGQILRTRLGALTRSNEKARVFLSTVKAFSSLITRAAGEKGVLTNLDVQRIINVLPNETDTMQIAKGKVETLRSLFNTELQSAIEAYLGSTFGGTLGGSQLQGGGSLNITKTDPLGIR